MKLRDVAAAISAHLKRFEKDPEINKPREIGKLHPYYNAYAWDAGRWVAIKYVSFQGYHNLTKDEAVRYLAWLDAGNVGKHQLVVGLAGGRR